MYFDPTYILYMLPGLVLSLLATAFVKSTFAKYSKVRCASGLTGAEAARAMLERNGITNVRIEHVNGFLSDHYDPGAKVLRLSDSVYGSNSLAAVGVACHEAGHALQDAEHYAAMGLRSALVPAANLGSKFSYWVILAGFLLQMTNLIYVGCFLFGAAVLFSIVTLPVEWNASSRAKVAMVRAGLLSNSERDAAGRVLNAAFLTYVAGAVSSLMTLLYYLSLARSRSSRR